MNERPCIRCRHPVLLEDGHLVYCSNCGAPQIFLSEELQAELAEIARAYHEQAAVAASAAAAAASTEAPPRPRAGSLSWSPLSWNPRSWRPLSRVQSASGAGAARPWPLGIRSALLSAAIALALGLLSLLLPPVGLLVVLWVIAAPILAVAFFHASFRAEPVPGTDFAARLGLLTGLLVVCCCVAIFTLSLVLTRFVFHNATLLDAQLAASFAQQRSILIARLGPDAQPTLNLFALPEYRVGLLLSVLATSAAVYLLLSTLAAAVADALLRRRRDLPGSSSLPG